MYVVQALGQGEADEVAGRVIPHEQVAVVIRAFLHGARDFATWRNEERPKL